MRDILDKINRAIDAVTDAVVDRMPAVNETKEYKASDLDAYVRQMQASYPGITRYTIAIDKAVEYAGKVYAGERFRIRIFMLAEDGSPIAADEKGEAYLGTVVIAEAVDKRLLEKMDGKQKRTFRCPEGGR